MARPTAQELQAALDRRLPDILAPHLAVVFCGINPGRWSAATGHHFAHPSNRFWRVLHGAGLTPELLTAEDDRRLLDHGMGITNLVPRTTATASELTRGELQAGASALRLKVGRWRPAVVAMVGVTAFRLAFARPKATVGRQDELLGATQLWVLPNPSGLQAAYQRDDLVRTYGELAPVVAGWSGDRASTL